MGYDKSRLIKIELWMRRLGWFYGAVIVLGILTTIYNSIKMWINPESFGYYGINNIYWEKTLYISGNFRTILMTVFTYLIIQGAAKIIRYLLALADEIYARYSDAASE